MIDYRIHTFLTLCETMNYRVTAEQLNITQPAVTQHIHFLESQYNCKLFEYNCRKLSKTSQGEMLEKHARSLVYNDLTFKGAITSPPLKKVSIGLTKTIGEYMFEKQVIKLLKQDDLELEIVIDNTENLFHRLNALKLDVLLIEGYFDKDNYDCELIKREALVGICAHAHRFANRDVSLEELLEEKVIFREEGSGTRDVFEHFLHTKGYSYESFLKKSFISSCKLIEKAVSEDCGVSFVYQVIPENNKQLSTFTLKGTKMFHEFNYVYLKNTSDAIALKELMVYRDEG